MNRVSPADARICRDCTNLVTVDEKCPLCQVSTEPHPQRHDPEHYCIACAKGPFQIAQLHLVTWNEDATMQCDDGDLSCKCLKCHAKD